MSWPREQTYTDALRLVEAGRSTEALPGNRAYLSRRGWAWYANAHHGTMILTPAGRRVLEARRDLP